MFLRIGALAALLVVFGFMGTRIYGFLREQQDTARTLQALQQKYEAAKIDEAKLQEELQYLSNPTNLEKELRARFNYRASDEKMIIIVPPHATSVSSTSP